MIRFIEKDDALIFNVRVVPKSSRSAIVGAIDGALKVKIKSPPVDGAANAELIKTLAEFFEVPKSAVAIIKGATSKNKQIKIEGARAANLPDLKTA